MKPLTGVFGIAAACAACCAVPLVLPLVFGAAGVGFGLMELPVAALVAGAIAGTALIVIMARRKRAKSCSIQTRTPL